MVKAFLFAGALFTAVTVPALTPAFADDPPITATFASVNEVFVDFLLNGCLSSMDGKMPVKDFASERQLFVAKDEISNAFLKGKPGKVYVHGGAAVVLSALDSGLCTVSARQAPMMMDLTDQVESWLIGPGAPFKKTQTQESGKERDGGASTMRVYEAEIAGHSLFAVLTTTAREDVLAQAVITVGLNY